MIRSFIRTALIFLVVITCTLWITLQTERAQNWAKKSIERALKKELNVDVRVGSVNAIAPFYFRINDISCSNPSLTIGSISLIPNWFGFLIGNVSFFYIQVVELDLRHVQVSNTQKTFAPLIPSMPIHVWSCSVHKLFLPYTYTNVFTNDLQDDIDTGLYFDLFSSIHTNPKAKTLSAQLTCRPTAQDFSIATATVALDIDKEESLLAFDIDAKRASAGSVFIDLPCDSLQFSSTVSGKTLQILDALCDTDPLTNPSLAGTWQLSLIKKTAPTAFARHFRLDAKGTLAMPERFSINFDTTEIACQEINPRIRDRNLGADQNPSEYATQIPLDGSLHMNLKRLPQTATYAISLSTPLIAYNDHVIRPLDITLDIGRTASDWQTAINLNATLQTPQRAPIQMHLSSRVTTDLASYATLADAEVSLGDMTLAGNLDIFFFPLQLSGRIVNTSRDMSAIFAALGIQAQGSGDLECRFTSQTTQTLNQTISIHAALDTINGQEFALDQACLDLHGTGIFPDICLQLDAKAHKLYTKHVTVDSITASLTHPYNHNQASTFSLQLLADTVNGPYKLASSGSFDTDTFQLDTVRLSACGKELVNKNPICCTTTDQKSVLSGFSLYCDERAALSAEARLDKDSLSCQMTLDNFPLPFFSPLHSATLFGSCSGRLELYGKYQSPQFHLQLSTSDLSIWPAYDGYVQPQMALLELDAAHGVCSLDATIQNPEAKSPLRLQLSLPFAFSLNPFSYTITPSQSINGILQGQFSLDSLFGPKRPDEEEVGGTINSALSIQGTYDKPHLSGEVGLDKGRLTLRPLNCRLSDISTGIAFDKNTARIDHFSCSDSLQGSMSLTGIISFTDILQPTYSIDAEMNDFVLVDLDDAYVKARGPFAIKGTSHEALLSGSCSVDTAKLAIAPSDDMDVPKLDLTYINKIDETRPFQTQPFQLRYDLNFDLAKNGRIVGSGLDSEWHGAMHLGGENRQISLEGKLETLRGTFTLGDKVFTLTRGSVDFRGPLARSELAVVAGREMPHLSAQIILKGPIEAPKIYLQSIPSMKEKEILSWILFDKGTNEISPVQGLQLAQAVIRLRNGTSFDVVDKIRSQFGLDRLDFGQKTTLGPKAAPQALDDPTGVAPMGHMPNEVSFQVGKYISDGVMVTLTKDITTEVNRIGIEAEVTNNITAEANVGDDAETQISLKWKYRY